MGLWNWIRTQVTGVDVNATQAQMNQSDAQLAALNQAALNTGLYTPAIYDQATAHWYTGQITDAGAQVDQAAAAGARQGLSNIASGINSAVNTTGKWTLKFIWDAIPWWVWLGLGVYVLWYFGILQRLVKAGTEAGLRKVGA